MGTVAMLPEQKCPGTIYFRSDKLLTLLMDSEESQTKRALLGQLRERKADWRQSSKAVIMVVRDFNMWQ